MSRPFEEQTPLERTLRALLYQPTDRLKRATEALPGHVKRKEFQAAADCQTTIRRATQEIKDWEHLLELYEDEQSSRSQCPVAKEPFEHAQSEWRQEVENDDKAL